MDAHTDQLKRDLNWVMFYGPERKPMPDLHHITQDAAKRILTHFTDYVFTRPRQPDHDRFIAALARSFRTLPPLDDMPEAQIDWLLQVISSS